MASSASSSLLPRTVKEAVQAAVQAHATGRLGEAEGLYREILRADSRNSEALHGLGLVAQQAGDLLSAERLIRAAIAVEREQSTYHSNLGNVLQMRGLLADAVAEYERALTLRPDAAAVLNNLGSALLSLGRPEEAEERLRGALAWTPASAQTADNLGNALQALGRLEEAVRCHERALELTPWNAEIHGNLGLALAGMGRWGEAMASFERALAIDSGNARVQLARAQLQLLRGDFEEGFRNYEWRKRVHGGRQLLGREWRGERIGAGAAILLYAEQGLGDTVQMLRYLPLVMERSGAAVVLEAQRPILRLARESAGIRAVVAAGDELPEYGWHCSLMSLPLIFSQGNGVYPHERRWEDQYLNVPGETVQAQVAGTRLECQSRNKLRVGLVWAGNRAHVRDRFRSIPFPLLEPLLGVGGVEFYSLQLGEAADEAAGRLIDWSGRIEDMADTAALISRLDLVIGVDTAVAHLAGALGKAVWTLLPFWPDWRWGLGREDCPWYPTMRLFRQKEPGDWARVMEDVLCVLAETVRRREA